MKGDEAVYTIPLRDVYEKPRKRRAKLAIKEIRKFAKRHGKIENEGLVKISNEVNAVVWQRSIEKPPRKVKVKLVKKEAYLYVLLPEQKIEDVVKKETREEEKKEKKEKNEQKNEVKEEKKQEVKDSNKEEKKEDGKKEEKKEDGEGKEVKEKKEGSKRKEKEEKGNKESKKEQKKGKKE